MDVEVIEAQSVLNVFLDAFFIRQDLDKVLACVSEDLFAVIPECAGELLDKQTFAATIRSRVLTTSPKGNYAIDQLSAKKVPTGDVHFFFQITKISEPTDIYPVKISYCAMFIIARYDDKYLISAINVSLLPENGSKKNFRFPEYSNNCIFDPDQSFSQGIISCFLEENCPLYCISPHFADNLGYSTEEFRILFSDSIEPLIHPDDRKATFLAIRNDNSKINSSFDIEFRAAQKDGKYIWFRGIGIRIDVPGNRRIAVSMCIDISESKQTQKELFYEKEHYRKLMECTQSTLYDYDINNDQLKLFYILETPEGKKLETKVIDNFSQNTDSDELRIYPADQDSFLWLLKNGQMIRGREMRIGIPTLNKSEYFWYEIYGTASEDPDGQTSHYIGLLRFIDNEKKRFLDLTIKAERDCMTKLYNKAIVEQKIKEIIETGNPNMNHAFLLLDIDHFKNINDTCGHPIGDSVLKCFADLLSETFRTDDIIGRIGGDEFVVFMRNIHDVKNVSEKAGKIIDSFCNNYFKNHLEENGKDICHFARKGKNCNSCSIHYSCSIGISFFYSDGDSFNELYHAADIALYKAKECGRNRFEFFEKEGSNLYEKNSRSKKLYIPPNGEELDSRG